MAIPKLIHQTTINKNSIVREIANNFDSLKKLNPDWRHNLYDNTDIKKYIESNISGSDFQEVEKLNPKYGVVLADLFRYLVIYNEGGVYLDDKSTAKRPLSDVIAPDTNFIISQWRNKLGQEFEFAGLHPELAGVPGGEFQQWHVIAAPNHPFLKAVIHQTLFNIRDYSPDSFGVGKNGVIKVSGPICYTLTIKPLLDRYPAEIVDIKNLGIQYSIYEDIGDHDRHTRSPNHYSNLKEPIIRKESYLVRYKKAANLGVLLARELEENTDIALKLAVFAIVSTATSIIILPLVLIWILSWYI